MMTQFEIDVARKTMYKIARYSHFIEKDAGIKETLLNAAEKYTPTFLSAGKKGLSVMEKHMPTFYPIGKNYIDNLANMADDFIDAASTVVKSKKILPSDTDGILKNLTSPLSGFAAGASTSPFVSVPLDIVEGKAADISKNLLKNNNSAFISKLRSASGAAASGIRGLRTSGIKNTVPDNIAGLIPYSVGLAVGGTVPPEFYLLPLLTAI